MTLALRVSPEEVGERLLLDAAVKFYESGMLSSVASSELAGISKPAFLTRLAEFGVPVFRQSADELIEECAHA